MTVAAGVTAPLFAPLRATVVSSPGVILAEGARS